LTAVDELFLARGCDDDGDIKGMRRHFANAWNHMAFALQIAMVQYETDLESETGLEPIQTLADRWDTSPEEIEVFLQNSGFYQQ